MNEHDIETMLRSAGARVRATAPDAVAAQRALQAARGRSAPPPAPNRSWWPTAIGFGLAAAATIGVIAYNLGDGDDTLQQVPADESIPVTEAPVPDPTVVVRPEPTSIEPPATTNVESPPTTGDLVVTGDATVVTLDGGRCVELRFGAASVSTIGCVGALDPAKTHFTASAHRAYVLVEAPADAVGNRIITADPITTGDQRLCGLVPSALTGHIVQIVSCNAAGETPVALAARLPNDLDGTATYFTTPHTTASSGAEFGEPALTVDDLVVLVGTATPGSPGLRCVAIVSTASGQWRETCGDADTPLPSGLITLVDEAVVQVDFHDGTAVLNVLDASVPRSSGCSFSAARELMATSLAAGSPTLIFDSLRCGAARASSAAGGVLLQPGPPDGTIEEFDRVDDTWVYRGGGTGIDEFLPHRNPSYATWTAWPGDAAPYVPPYLQPASPDAPILDVGATLTEPLPTVDELVAAVVDHIDRLASDPEFPANTRALAVQPDGLPLIVIQQDVGGDDSVSGAVVFVWFEPVPDPATGAIAGYRLEATYVSQLCWRGASGGGESPLCI